MNNNIPNKDLILSLEKEVQFSHDRECKMQESYQLLKQKVMKLESLKDEFDELQCQMEKIKQENLQLKMTVTDLRSQKSEQSRGFAENTTLRNQIKSLTRELQQAANRSRTAPVISTESFRNRISKLEVENEELFEKNVLLTKEMKAISSTLLQHEIVPNYEKYDEIEIKPVSSKGVQTEVANPLTKSSKEEKLELIISGE